MRLHKGTSPWARKRIDAKIDATIRLAGPEDHTAEFVYGDGWTCRIRDGDVVVGEAFHMFTLGGSFAAALKDMQGRQAA